MIPGMGIDPGQMAEVQKVSKYISAEIEVNHKTNVITIKMASDNPDAAALIPNLLEQFANALAQQLNSIFAITGKIVIIKAEEAKPSEPK